jgi:RNase P subunit RPR2
MKSAKLSKQEIKEKIQEIFSSNPSPKEIKKIKKLAMSKNIKLGDFKKEFCNNCYILFNSNNSEIRIKKPYKIIKCKICGFIKRYKLSH